jgi:hypothetical protein
MRKMRLSNADLPSLARYREKRSKLLLVLFVVHLAHVVNVSVADLILPPVVPGPDDPIFVKSLDDHSAVSLQLIVEGKAALNLKLSALF